MAWEWLSVTVTGVVGLASIGAAVAVAAIGRRQAENLSRTSARSSLATAREERLAGVLANAVEVMIRHSMDTAILARQYVNDEERSVKIDGNDVDEIGKWVARVSVFASPDLGQLFRNWQISCAGLLSSAMRKNNSPEEVEQVVMHIQSMQSQFLRAAHEAVNTEFFSDTKSS